MIHVHRPYIGNEEKDAVARVLDSRWLGMGSVTKEFEDRLRELTGARHAFAVNTGTAALHLAFEALMLGPEDEVILPSITFVSTVQAVLAAGGRPVFCEVSEKSLNMDADDAFARVTPRTKAILPVHYAGLPCDMDTILSKARQLGIMVVEDAAHAFGSRYKGRMIGSLGDMTCFSFDPIKNITCGGGGAITTDDDGFAKIINTTRNVGMELDSWERTKAAKNWHYDIVSSGFRYCMNNINAAIGLEQMQRFDDFKKRKQSIVACYDEAFKGLEGIGLLRHDPEGAFPFSYVIKVHNGLRDRLMSFLKDKGIGTSVQFIPNHMQKRFAKFKTPLPVTEKLYGEIITLPLYYEMEDSDMDMVISSVTSFFKGKR